MGVGDKMVGFPVETPLNIIADLEEISIKITKAIQERNSNEVKIMGDVFLNNVFISSFVLLKMI